VQHVSHDGLVIGGWNPGSPKCKDSGIINFAGGNPFSTIAPETCSPAVRWIEVRFLRA
jgi:hypothetical protein